MKKVQVVAKRDCLPRGSDDPRHRFQAFLKKCKIKEGTMCSADNDDISENSILILTPKFDAMVPDPVLMGGLYYHGEDFREATNVDKLLDIGRRKNETLRRTHLSARSKSRQSKKKLKSFK